ncbi:MAG TPA: hypothetical protein DDY37_03340 [Legionella sp.]|nr:hypothetical protein [Legionella sp.]
MNDSLGHDNGDDILQQTAARMMACVRNEDTVARMGGDEFAIILLDIYEPKQAQAIVEKLLSELKKPFQIKKKIYT